MLKLPYLSFSLVILLTACNSASEEIQTEPKKNTPEQNDSTLTSTESVEIVLLDDIDDELNTIKVGSVENEIVAPFYDNQLKELYPDRELITFWHEDRLTYESSLAENIEGGGISLNYLQVLDSGTQQVGIIGFELFDNVAYTNCFAVLNVGQYLCATQVIDIQGYPILEVTSNSSGNKDLGPYDYSYYYFAKNDDRTTPLYVAENMEEFKPDASISQLIIDELNNPSAEH
jgi:hypothetical protein